MTEEPEKICKEPSCCPRFMQICNYMNHKKIPDYKNYTDKLLKFLECESTKISTTNPTIVAFCCWSIVKRGSQRKFKHRRYCSVSEFKKFIADDPVENFKLLASKYNWIQDGRALALGFNLACVKKEDL